MHRLAGLPHQKGFEISIEGLQPVAAGKGEPHLSAAALPDSRQGCALEHPARLAEFLHHHAQLRVFRKLPSNYLPDARDVTVYLPAGYDEQPERRYPVLYLHDGQNLFNPETSFVPGQYWRVEQTADAVIEAGEVEPLIIVGVNNAGARRLAEYTHSRDKKMGGGEADCYGLLLVKELIPFINQTFRTKTGPAHTGLGGSSLGGLVSLYLGMQYPEVFGRLAVMSPSIWWDRRSILKVLEKAGKPAPLPRIWLDAGDAEGGRCQPDAQVAATQLTEQGWRPELDIHYEWIPGGTHTEEAWAARVGPMLRWLFPAEASGQQ